MMWGMRRRSPGRNNAHSEDVLSAHSSTRVQRLEHRPGARALATLASLEARKILACRLHVINSKSSTNYITVLYVFFNRIQ